MRKIGEIYKENSNIWTAILIGGIGTIILSYFSYLLLNVKMLNYLNEDKIWEILLITPIMMLIFIIHEYIHVFFFKLFGKGKAEIRVNREKSVGAIVMHQVNPNVYYNKWQMIVILLSPLFLITLILLILSSFISAPVLIFINIFLNALGSSIDMYVSIILLFKYRSTIKINFDSHVIKMNIYEK